MVAQALSVVVGAVGLRDRPVCPGGRCGGQAIAKTKLKQLHHLRLGIGQGDQAVADVAGRQDMQLLAELAGGAAIVGDGDDGGQVAGVALEAAQQGREARAASQDDEAASLREFALLIDQVHQAAGGALRVENAGQGGDQFAQSQQAQQRPGAGQEQAEGGRTDLRARLADERVGEAHGQGGAVGGMGLEEDADADQEDEQSQEGQGDPAFDVHTRIQPFQRGAQPTHGMPPAWAAARAVRKPPYLGSTRSGRRFRSP